MSLLAYVIICVATTPLFRVVHTGDIKHQYEVCLICVTLLLCRYVASVNQALYLTV